MGFADAGPSHSDGSRLMRCMGHYFHVIWIQAIICDSFCRRIQCWRYMVLRGDMSGYCRRSRH